MKIETVQIVERGRGPQLASSRITVLDVFYYLHRGYDFDFIQRAMPTLTRGEFDAVVCYVSAHHDELLKRDRHTEELNQREAEAQHARGGIFAGNDDGP